MGGIGSGRKFESSLPVSRNFIRCDIAEFRKIGVFKSVHSIAQPPLMEVELNGDYESPLRVRLCVGTCTGYGGEGAGRAVPRERWVSETSMFVRIVASTPHYGGWRYSFLCPRGKCQRSCRVLYRPRHGNARAFACRQCHRIAYQTQRMGKTSRLIRRIDRIVDQLGIDGEWLAKPKGMHWRVYHRICDEHDRLSKMLWKRTFSRLVAPPIA
jgi:hypothetical protein